MTTASGWARVQDAKGRVEGVADMSGREQELWEVGDQEERPVARAVVAVVLVTTSTMTLSGEIVGM